MTSINPPDATAVILDPGPEAASFSPELEPKLRRALHAKGPNYKPRTRHLRADGAPLYVNRLLLEASPYLQQHAHNPVHWFAWGDEAFATARELGRPVLLSVGYATCHWCHVMEEESFEDLEIAAFMNANYVAIKVDREERPDVDSIYMACVQAWSGHGGWPMTVWLTAERLPFFGGTYFPPRDGARGVRAGFLTILKELKTTFSTSPERVIQTTSSMIAHLSAQQRQPEGEPAAALASLSEVAASAYRYYERAFDPHYGGMRGAPKFPSSLPTRLLLRYGRRYGEEAVAMAVTTLAAMAAGGMHDHVGGGFHRYSVDAQWLVPHFEKMLYDNALLAQAYLEASQLTGRDDFALVATRILDYVGREMTAASGGFYAATDADSPNPERGGERDEGWFFTWTPAELNEVLGAELYPLVAAYYAVTSRGNFEGRSILHTPRPLAAVAGELGLPPVTLAAKLEHSRQLLYAARALRPKPLLDDKVITSWHALMLSAFARAAAVLRRPDYLATATQAALFIKDHLFVGERLTRCFKDGPSRTGGFIEDYAATVAAFLDLYEASFEPSWLALAVQLTDLTQELFAAPGGGYFMTSHDAEELLVRERPAYDGAIPSGNSVHALNLLRLAQMTGRGGYRQQAEQLFTAFAPLLNSVPAALSEMLLATDFAAEEPWQIVLVAATLPELEPF